MKIMIILGIDPGTATTGFAIIKIKNLKLEIKNGNLETIEFGCIKTLFGKNMGERLIEINKGIDNLIKKYKPSLLAIESIYFFKNLKTAMPVSQAKGVILYTAAKNKIPVCEITPLQMKMTIAGYGKAEKKQVQKMIKIIFNLDKIPKMDDAADALGIAFCGAMELRDKNRFKQ
ncbi:MAG: Crossover junction endodeoxyribonuclease RuvC [Parcubacteria group bacterium GW2011_GWC2_39_11]|nr:MAG: Crossover junction endodeoxyribonuclease RuvC [Parcubacteria group bacterium GW2011_GWA2_38_27]KKQ96316.1 MAG: Crossover junction endodeoxyribonuclease RuvC [Parcubacteria group bacterium GW2011_GWC2_39_11]